MDWEKFGIFTFVVLFLMLLIPLGAISGFSVSGISMQTSYHYVGWLIFIGISCLLIMFFLIRFRHIDFGQPGKWFKRLYRPKDEQDQVQDYIEYKLSIGENRLVIREDLLSIGWPEWIVNEAFKDVDNTYNRKRKNL